MQPRDGALKPDFAQIEGRELTFRRKYFTRAVLQAAFSNTFHRTAGATQRERFVVHSCRRLGFFKLARDVAVN